MMDTFNLSPLPLDNERPPDRKRTRNKMKGNATHEGVH